MDYSLLAIIFLGVGLALLVAEVFIPSGGFILVLALSAVGASLYCAWEQWWDTSPQWWWLFLMTVLLAMPTVMGGAFFVLPRTRFGNRVLLEAPTREEVTAFRRDREHLTEMVGQRGVTLTKLSPGGLAQVNGERIHCESPSILVPAGVTVEVIQVRGNRIVVRPVPETDSPGDAFLAEDDASSDAPPSQAEISPGATRDSNGRSQGAGAGGGDPTASRGGDDPFLDIPEAETPRERGVKTMQADGRSLRFPLALCGRDR